MTGWWVHELYHNGEKVLLVSWMFWVITSIVLHELAHGWAALWQGDDTPRRYGHMTWNPLVHMGPMSLLMFAAVGIAWGQMPVDPSRFKWGRQGRFVVAAAGPAMNVALALIALTLLPIWLKLAHGGVNDPLYSNVAEFLWVGGWLNFVLAMFNLLPIPPLDGSNILAGLWLRWYIWMQNPQFMMVGFFILLVFFFSEAGSIFFEAGARLGFAVARFWMNIFNVDGYWGIEF